MPSQKRKPRVLSGIQSSGNLHIGNYLGAIKNWVQDQDHYENYFMIADYHAITVLPDSQALRQQKRELIGLLLACGLDPNKSVIFEQSAVAEHMELAWILTCVTPVGWLERMTQYKDKTQKINDKQSIGAGLLIYPTLMASDILIYQADEVPVGEDQRQHVEITRDIAQRFNHLYGETFTIPAVHIRESGARIMDLTDPQKKMSKSGEDSAGRLGLLDHPDELRKKIKTATTDSMRDIVFDPGPERAGLFNLLTIYLELSGQSKAEIEAHFSCKGYKHLKEELGELVVESLAPIQKRYAEMTADPGYLNQFLKEQAAKAKVVASKTLRDVRQKIGID